MGDENDKAESENNSLRQATGLDLEARLKVPPSLDTYAMDFLVIAGLTEDAWYCLSYQDTSEDVRNRIQEKTTEKYKNRRADLSLSEMHTETRFVNALKNEYFSEPFKTLRDFKTDTENHGLLIPQIGYKGLAYFNSILGQYAIEPIKVASSISGPKILAKHGLEPSGH